jgi:sortase A
LKSDISADELMKMRTLERIVLSVGVTLVAMWGAAQMYRSVGSEVAINRFESAPANTVDGTRTSSTFDLGLAADVRLWSIERVKAFHDSLVKKTDPPLGVLEIPAVDLEAPIFDGTDDLTLNRGVGRILGTARLGQKGNLGIAGHRDGFFRRLKDIQLGDTVEVDRPGFEDEYVVGQAQVVGPEDVRVLDSTSTSTLTLVTCFPFYYVGSAPKRFVVTAHLIATGPNVRARSRSWILVGDNHKEQR